MTLYSLNKSNVDVLPLRGEGSEQQLLPTYLIIEVFKLNQCYFEINLPIFSRVTVSSLREARDTSTNVQTSSHISH